MIRLELRRVLQEGAVLLLLLAGLAAGILATRQDAYLAPALEIFLLLYASFTGWALLDRERQEGALEALFALPAPRLRLLALKALPRALFLASVLALYAGLHRLGQLPSYLPPTGLALLASLLFLTSLSFSVTLKSFFSAGAVSAMLVFGLAVEVKWLDPLLSDGQAIVRGGLPLLLLPLLFAACFRFLDMRPAARFNRRFLPAALLVVAAAAAALYVLHAHRWRCHFILADGAVVRSACDSCRASEWIRGDERRRFPACIHVLRRVGGRYYVDWRTRERGRWHTWLASVDFAAGRVRKLFPVDLHAGWVIDSGRFMEAGSVLGGNWYLLLQNFRSRECRVLEVSEAGVRELSLRFPGVGRSHEFLVHAVGAPLRFLTESNDRVRLVSAAGNVQDLGPAISYSAWGERLLLVQPDGLRLYDLRADPRLLWERLGRARKMSVSWAPVEQPFALVRLGNQAQRIDLAAGTSRPLPERVSPHYYFARGDSLWLVESPRYGQLRFRKLDPEGRVVAERRFRITIRPFIFRAFPDGVVAFNDSGYEAFAFPK